MPKRIQLPIGSKYGKLTILELADDIVDSGGHRTAYRCLCDCGNECIAKATLLKNGKKISCGCMTGFGSRPRDISLIGQVFERLTVIEQAEDFVDTRGRHNTQYKCRCECGREVIARATNLKRGMKISCGYCHLDKKYDGHIGIGQHGNKFIDLTGMTFGHLTVLERGPDKITPKGTAMKYWWAQCDCGNKVLVDGNYLKNGKKESCGCQNAPKKHYDHYEDLTSQVFGKLTVIGPERPPVDGRFFSNWNCRCECGREVVVPIYSLKSRSNISCGKCKYENRYEFHDGLVIGHTNTGKTFMVDIEDYDKIKDYYWRIDKRTGYVETLVGSKRLMLHRHVMDAEKGDIIDHISHNITDNRKSNLRKVSAQQNAANRKKRADNKSGYTGVYFHKSGGNKPWRAMIKVDGDIIHLGTFYTIEEAVSARKAAEQKYFGEYSYEQSIASVPAVSVTIPAPVVAPVIPAPAPLVSASIEAMPTPPAPPTLATPVSVS